MSISGTCGHHCGISNGAERHCDCSECSCPQAVRVLKDVTLVSWGPDLDSPFRPTRVPMCERWYERSEQPAVGNLMIVISSGLLVTARWFTDPDDPSVAHSVRETGTAACSRKITASLGINWAYWKSDMPDSASPCSRCVDILAGRSDPR